MPNMNAILEHHINDGNLVEIKIWRVPISEHTPHGFKYSLVYIVNGERIVGYDNERGKGDHRHFEGAEYAYRYHGVQALFNDFKADMEAAKRRE